jgi:hypothetical protein
MHKLQQLPWLTLAAVAGMALAGCRPAPAPTADENITNELAQPAPLPVVEPPIDRERLLTSVARAASAYAAGNDNSEADRALDGRRFEVRLRFGCGRGAAGADVSGWTVDASSKTIRLKAVPDLSFDDPLVRNLAGREGVEAVEGFWLKRPWLLTAACPAPRAAEAKVPAQKGQTADPAIEEETQLAPRAPRVGIAQFFTATDSRTRRRSARPYESVKPLEEGSELGVAGFNLVLSGRLRAGPAGRVIACGSASIDTWPDCIIFADIDQVRMERPETREVIAEWAS